VFSKNFVHRAKEVLFAPSFSNIFSINNGLNFDENIMEQLEFKPCLKCVN
jgi:hypothetical protein